MKRIDSNIHKDFNLLFSHNNKVVIEVDISHNVRSEYTSYSFHCKHKDKDNSDSHLYITTRDSNNTQKYLERWFFSNYKTEEGITKFRNMFTKRGVNEVIDNYNPEKFIDIIGEKGWVII